MNKAWYALRRTLPPWKVDENLAELVEFCVENRVDEVIAKVDSEEFTHGLPTVEWVDGYLPVLRKMKDAIERVGVVFSINPWVTLVHCDRGRDIRTIHPDVGLMVGHDGAQCKSQACPMSEGWRSVTRKLWQRYASLQPDVLWVEDDIRLLNHQPAVYGCFCQLHITELSCRVGRDVSREELVEALLAPGEPHPFRRQWLELNRDVMVDMARFFERTVHEVSPETKLGLMCSTPDSHAIEGRDWEKLTLALAGTRPLVVRPCMFNYNESSPRGLYDAEFMVRSTVHCLPPGAVIQTEVENVPFSIYSKSTTFTFLQMALSFAVGADGVTMNLFDHMGSPMRTTPEFGNMLREKKPFLNALAERCRGGKSMGVQLVHSPEGSYHVRVEEGTSFHALAPEGSAWRHVLEPLGFALTYEESTVVALTGQAARCFSDARIRNILSRGVLLDLTAFKCLSDMGYRKLLGASLKREFRKLDEPLSAEEYFNADFGGADRKYLTLTLPDLGGDVAMAEIVPDPRAHVVSRVVNPDTQPVYPFLTVFENSLGGRVAMYPVDMGEAAGPAFLGHYRKEQIDALVRWLSRGEAPMCVSGGAYPLPFLADFDDRTVIGVFNLSLDEWPRLNVHMSTGRSLPHRIESLSEDGIWREEASATCTALRDEGMSVDLCKPLSPLSLAVLTLWWWD